MTGEIPFEGRYAIERELGRGGMAVVLLARDLRHPRQVAIKILRAELADEALVARFRREVDTLAGLSHPHIVPLIDSGASGDALFFVMPYIEGETLRARLERQGQLPVDEAVRIAIELADALEYSHARNVIHRDIKPENVFMASGHAMLADFGIARAVTSIGKGLTDTGMAIGTPAYMSPEQALAGDKIDGRADQYALGCVLYEMLAGVPPFSGATPHSVISRHLTDPVPPLKTVRAIPAGLESIVLRSLEKAAADRWPSVREMAAALKDAMQEGYSASRPVARPKSSPLRLVIATAAMAIAAFAAYRIFARPSSAARDATPLAVAVLPFAYAGDSAQSVYADGLANDLVIGLVRRNLSVSDPLRLEQFRTSVLDVIEIGKRLDVDAIVSATVRVSGNDISVTARLTDVRNGHLLWAERYDGALEVDGRLADPADIVGRISGRILDALQPRLAGDAAAEQSHRSTNDRIAYEEYQRGLRALRNVQLSGAQIARRHFEVSVARDPQFADAWIGMANAIDQLLQLSSDAPTSLISQLQEALAKASALDSLHPSLIAPKARARLWFQFDISGYDQEMRRGIARYPNNAGLHFAYGQDLNVLGLMDSGLAEVRRAVALDATNPFMVGYVGTALAASGRLLESRTYTDEAIRLDSTLWLAWLDRAVVASHEGRWEDAARFAKRAHDLQDGSPWIIGYYLQCTTGAKVADRSRTYEMLLARAESGNEYIQHALIAQAHLAMDKHDLALDALESSLRMRDRDLLTSVGFGVFEELRGEPRYERVVREIGLAPSMRDPNSPRSGANYTICATPRT